MPSLWDFATGVYTGDTIAPACLELQDNYQWNIPLLLFCCWAGNYYGALSAGQSQWARSFAEHFSATVTQPLRVLRRNMKTSYHSSWPVARTEWEGLREQVKTLELDSEKLLLESLEQRFLNEKPINKPLPGHSVTTVLGNIGQCFDITAGSSINALLTLVLSAVFDPKNLPEIKSRLDGFFRQS